MPRINFLCCTLLLVGICQPAALAAEWSWQEDCAKAKSGELKPPAIANRLTEQELKVCDEQDLYYGFIQPADPVAALQCAYHQRTHSGPRAGGNPFFGPGVLSMLYANGRGVVRNIDLAIRFSCENEWAAPAEMQARIQHLESLRRSEAKGEVFDLCDDATSGLMGGACASVRSRQADVSRSQRLAEIQANWKPELKQAYVRLAAAEQAFSDARIDNEVDLTGSARNAFAIRERDQLLEQRLINLQAFAKGQLPAATSAEATAADEELNAVYRQLMQSPADRWSGTVKPEGIRATERAWIAMRDAWVEFGRMAYPTISADRLRARLTRQRVHQLRSLL